MPTLVDLEMRNVGGLFEADPFDSPVDHHLVDGLPVLAVAVGAHLRVEGLEGHACDVDAAPHGHCVEKRTG